MKYSLMTTSMVFPLAARLQAGEAPETIREDYRKLFAMIAACGIPAVEVTSLELDLFGFDTVQEALNLAGLECACVIHMDMYAETDPARHEPIVTSAKEKILAAKALGAKYVMLALMAQPEAEQHSMSDLQESLIRNLQPIAAFGKQNGITISVEDTPDIRLPLCDSNDIRPLLDAVHDLSLTYDTGNMILKNEDTLSFYRTLNDRVVYVHLKDMAYTESREGSDPASDGRRVCTVLPGTGVIDFPSVLRELKQNGYNGWLMLEYAEHENHERNIKAAKETIDAAMLV